LNAYAERFVLSIRSECLNHVVPLGERHLRLLVSEFVERAATANDNGRVQRHKRIGGMLSFYHRAAA
jgi:hypothetical protein